jgi:DNA-binding transcriptional LysR family regulator
MAMPINHKSLEALRAFVETGSVSGASDRLFRTAPQISRLLSALEDEVGFPVLSRRGRRLRLTKEGKEFYQEVERLMLCHDDLNLRADQIRRGKTEHIRILAAPFISHAVINQTLAHIMMRRPDMTAQIDSRVRLDIDVWVTEETFDLGIAPLPIKEGVFNIEPFLELPMVAVMNPSHPLAAKKIVTFDDFSSHQIIATHARSLLGQHLQSLVKRTGKRLNVRVEARNGVIACQMAGLNLGCCLADPFVALSSGVDDLVIRPFEPGGILKYGFLYPAGRNRTEIVDEVATEIRHRTTELARHIFDDDVRLSLRL